MKILPTLLILATLEASFCIDVKELFEIINKKTENYNALAADIAWESSVNPGNPDLEYKSNKYQKGRITWEQSICDELATLHNSQLLNNSQSRQTYLLCRGPKYTFGEARLTRQLYETLQRIYTDAEICISTDENISKTNLTQVEEAILKYFSSKSLYQGGPNNKKESFLNRLSIKSFSKRDYTQKHIPSVQKKNSNGGLQLCLKGEDDFQNLMSFSRNEEVLKWLWLIWREKVASLKEPYIKLVNVQNAAARRNGYQDIGASWRDEQEVPNLRQVCRRLYDEIRPLYSMLHGVVRFFLRKEYGSMVPKRGPIPAHLLGNLWSQNWESLADLISKRTINLDESIRKLNWTVEHMVKRAEDFYQSLSLPPMTKTFWERSVLERNDDETRCHGAAADMFRKNDFRLIYCSGTKMEDFYVLHHEMGHIQYYMAYENQPALFRQANSALHEAIGDAIMLGVMTPQHLHRLNIINDSDLYEISENDESIENIDGIDTEYRIEERFKTDFDKLKDDIKRQNDKKEVCNKEFLNEKIDDEPNENDQKADNENLHTENFSDNYIEISKRSFKDSLNMNNVNQKGYFKEMDYGSKLLFTTDEVLILKQGLSKIPQIPFSLLIDEYRWRVFAGWKRGVNKMFWDMALELQGISPRVERGEEYFDAGAKFHVPDNTPYIRYFLSSFLQYQLFESLCKASVFGRRNVKEEIPDSIALHRCDIYGSKSAGKLLKDIMSRGNSQHWQQILQETIGESDISTASLVRYYRPLYRLLTKLIRLYRIPIGW